MSNINTNDVRKGNKLLIEKEPCIVLDFDAVKPGKGQAFNRIKVKNMLTGRVVERTYKSGETIELADIAEVEMTYLYYDGEYWIFMDTNSFEQIQVEKSAMEDASIWVKEQDICTITLWNDKPMHVAPPMFVVRKIVECEPGVRGDTVSGVMKNAVIETGAQIKVPLFVELDDIIKVDTRTGEYVNRVKE